MPKKSASARGGAQRKPKAQKSFEVVRQSLPEQELASENEASEQPEVLEEMTFVPTSSVSEVESPRRATSARASKVSTPVEEVVPERNVTSKPAGSAAARLASRRQSSQRGQGRSAAALITPEHYAYVRKDLVFIGILALIMVAVLVGLIFVPGIGFLNG